MTKLKLALISSLIIAGIAAPLLVQHRADLKLSEEREAWRRQNDLLTERVASLVAENLRLSNHFPETQSQDNQPKELLRLRGAVARLSSEAQELARLKAVNSTGAPDGTIEATAQTLASRASQLKRRLEDMPGLKIPELQFLEQKDWLDAVSKVKQLETEEDFRKAINNLRSTAKNDFGTKMQKALRQFTDASGGMLPTDISQLQPYFESPVDPSMLSRYQLIQTGSLSDVGRAQNLISEIAPPVDNEYDTRVQFGLNSMDSSSVNRTDDALKAAATAYALANRGVLPQDPTQLAPYLQQSIDPGRIQHFLAQIPPGITTLDQIKNNHR